jgi:hypothetical protein
MGRTKVQFVLCKVGWIGLDVWNGGDHGLKTQECAQSRDSGLSHLAPFILPYLGRPLVSLHRSYLRRDKYTIMSEKYIIN